MVIIIIVQVGKNYMTKIYLVEYNDRFGNGDNKSFEGYVESQEDFKKWLVEHNKERMEEQGTDRDSEGYCMSDESEDEFTLHLLTKL